MAKFTEFNAPIGVAGPISVRRATAEDFGSGKALVSAGEKITDFGEQLLAAKVRSDNTLNTVRRARSFKEYSSAIAGERIRLQTEGDPTNPNLPREFGEFMQKEADRLLSEHRETGGDDRSVGKLTARFIQLQTEAADQVGAELAKQRRDLVIVGVDTNVGAIAIQAGKTGDLLGGFLGVRAEIMEAEDVLKPREERKKTMAGYAAVTTEVFNRRAESRDLVGMKAALAYVDVNAQTGDVTTAKEALGATAYRTLRNRIVSMEYDNDTGARAATALKAKVAGILGVDPANLDLDDADTRQLLGMDRIDTEPGIKSVDAGIKLYAKVMKIKPEDIPEDVLQKIRFEVLETQGLKIGETADGTFGTSLRGYSKNIVVTNAQLFASGQIELGSHEERLWVSAVLELQRPVVVGTNPITNQPILMPGTLPPYIVDAYQRRGLLIPRPNWSRGQGVQPPSGPGTPPDAKDGDNIITLFDGTQIDITKTDIRPEQTLFGRLGLLTGIGTGLSAFVAESALGSAAGYTAEEVLKARTDAKLFSIKVANALTKDNNVRAASERENLIEKMDIQPTLAEEGALRPKLFAVADLIISVIKKDVNILNTLSSPASQQAALNEMRNLNFLLLQLGVPILVKTKADALRYPAGTLIRDVRGRIGTTTGNK